jgi:hypothetical protein
MALEIAGMDGGEIHDEIVEEDDLAGTTRPLPEDTARK